MAAERRPRSAKENETSAGQKPRVKQFNLADVDPDRLIAHRQPGRFRGTAILTLAA